MGCCDGRQAPEADRGNATGNGRCGGTWIWRGRHWLKRNMTRRNAKPWLAKTRRRTAKPEPAPAALAASSHDRARAIMSAGRATASAVSSTAQPSMLTKPAQYTSPMRASWQTSTRAAGSGGVMSCCAIARRSETGITGRPAAKARPWVTLAARRSPVNAPGPRPKAIASSAASAVPASSSNVSTINSSCAPCPRAAGASRPISVPSCQSAALQDSLARSSARIFMPAPCRSARLRLRTTQAPA